MSLRAAREQAYWDHWRKALRDNPRDGLPAFLDALEAIDAEHAVPSIKVDLNGEITEEQAAELREKLAEAVKPQPARARRPRGGTAGG